MKIFTYKKWDGTQDPFRLHKKDVVDRFMENILKGMRPNTSLAQMFWLRKGSWTWIAKRGSI